ncbi:hypothetical protein TNCV_4101771 [Trichonephila clavipes]|nr:hypothetical protein TNCV_4101771 [Trichonephila clavipes]
MILVEGRHHASNTSHLRRFLGGLRLLAVLFPYVRLCHESPHSPQMDDVLIFIAYGFITNGGIVEVEIEARLQQSPSKAVSPGEAADDMHRLTKELDPALQSNVISFVTPSFGIRRRMPQRYREITNLLKTGCLAEHHHGMFPFIHISSSPFSISFLCFSFGKCYACSPMY